MAQSSGFFNAQLDSLGNFDRVYLAEQFATYFSNFVGNGVFAHLFDKLVVTAGGGLRVNVAPGKAFAKGFWFESDEIESLQIEVPDGVQNRKDNIVVRFDFQNRRTVLTVIKGTPSSNPQAPEVVRTQLIFDLKIAEVFVGASVSSITQSAITDTRADSNVCGWVTGLIDQIDTSDLFLQWNTWFIEQKAAFDEWMETLTQELHVDGYVKTSEFHSAGIGSAGIIIPSDGFNQNKKINFADMFINGLRVRTFANEEDIPSMYNFMGDYFGYILKRSGSIRAYYAKKINDNDFQLVRLNNTNEIIVRIAQFKEGVQS